jgi:hypothetical protein
MKTNFQRAKLMLDAMMPSLPDDGPAAVKQKILSLGSLYPSIWNPSAQPIDYSDAATQAAYVFTYLGANADLIYQTLRGAHGTAKLLLDQPEPKIACMGGGPGSDLLGLVKFAERFAKKPKKLIVEVLDHHLAWWDMWDHTLATFPDKISYSASIREMNYCNEGSWVKEIDFLQSDIFLFSYSLSEAWRYNSDGSITAFLDMIINSAKAGALFIYSDNSGVHFDPHFEREFVTRSNLRVVHRHSYDHMIVGNDEQTSDLEPHLTTFSPRKPKLTGNATCAALVKI